jgi:hypothetical protein
MVVWAGLLARLIAVFEHPCALVLEYDLVLVGIGDRRIGQISLLLSAVSASGGDFYPTRRKRSHEGEAPLNAL